MSKLFLFSIMGFFEQISIEIVVIINNSLIIALSAVCIVLTILKREYGVKRRLWVAFLMVGICFVQLWIELSLSEKARYIFLTMGISFCSLSLILFLPQKKVKISEDGRNFARLISAQVKSQTQEKQINEKREKSEVYSSPIIKTQPKNADIASDFSEENKREIDFSHVKSVIDKLEYYPLKEQDKKQAKDLENAIIYAEQNGMNNAIKEKINDGLGALLKIMSKYAV